MKDRQTAYVIGNGMSRRGVDLRALKEKGILIGCNEIFREIAPDYLVALDFHLPHIKAIIDQDDRPYKLVARDRKCWICLDGRPFMHQENILDGRNNNSGIIAVWFAAHFLQCSKIYLVGYDFFRPVPRGDPRFEVDGQRANDITNGSYHIGQGPLMSWAIEQIIADHPDTHITRVGPIYPWDAEFFEESFRSMELIEKLPA